MQHKSSEFKRTFKKCIRKNYVTEASHVYFTQSFYIFGVVSLAVLPPPLEAGSLGLHTWMGLNTIE